jgi:hypothetical protein
MKFEDMKIGKWYFLDQDRPKRFWYVVDKREGILQYMSFYSSTPEILTVSLRYIRADQFNNPNKYYNRFVEMGHKGSTMLIDTIFSVKLIEVGKEVM